MSPLRATTRLVRIREREQTDLTSLCFSRPLSGVYDFDPAQTVQFLLDYKTDGPELHGAVLAELEHFRSRDLLTSYDASTGDWTVRPVTVVCTGNCPVDLVRAQQPRYVFYDAPLAEIDSVEYGGEVAPLASTSLRRMFGTLGSLDLDGDRLVEIRRLVSVAHSKGIKTRFWETPG